MTALPKLKLTYFDKPGRAEAIRTMFRLAGVRFEDERLTREAFLKLKHTLPYGHVPVLEVDGEVIAEARAIERYTARLTGFSPVNDPVAALMVDEILARVSDLSDVRMVPIIRQKDAQQRKHQVEALVKNYLPAAFIEIDARLEWMRSYPLFRDAPSNQLYLHEIVVGTFLEMLRTDYSAIVPASLTVGYAAITAVHEKLVAALAANDTTRIPPPSAVAVAPVARPTKLRLTYLDLRARGEFVRLALHIGGVSCDDERVTYEQIKNGLRKLPYRQVPVLEIDGRVLAQTFALLRYAGTLSGLYPVDEPFRAAKIDELVSRVEDFYCKLQPSADQKLPETRRTLREQLLADQVLQATLGSLDKRIAQWKKPMATAAFVFGEKMTIVDLAVYLIVDYIQRGDFDYIPETIADNCTALIAIHAAVSADPRVQDWYATHGRQ